MAAPKASLVRQTENRTVWLIKFPSTVRKQGRAYYATTYPDSELLFIETAAKRRPVSHLVASRLTDQIKQAIAAKPEQPKC